MSNQNSLLPEDQLILAVVKLQPSGSELLKLNALIAQVEDWDYLITTIIARGIGPLFYKKLPLLTNSTLIPAEISKKLQQVYYKTFSRSMVLYEHFRKVSTAFNIHQIHVIALKGIYLSEWLYHDIGLRQFSDIDLLVKEEDAANCLSILENLGYDGSEYSLSTFVTSQFTKNSIHYPPMIKDGVSIEVHTKLHRNTQSYQVILPKIWSNCSEAIINNVPILVLNDIDLLIYLCLHLDKHFKGGHIQFTCFTDISNLLEKDADTMDWEKLIEVCQLYRCEDIVFLYIVMVNKFIHVTVPQQILERYRYLLLHDDEELFIKYLKGTNSEILFGNISSHTKNLNSINNIFHKIRYVWNVLFPSKVFMINMFKIKNPAYVIFYYPYRHYIRLKELIYSLFKNSKK